MNSQVKSENNGRRKPAPKPVPHEVDSAAKSAKSIERLMDLAKSIFTEVQSLIHEETLTELFTRATLLKLSPRIDFYDEVARFEADLIKMALEHTGGHQARAARLLHLPPTTLNKKIRDYGILVKAPRPNKSRLYPLFAISECVL